MKFVLKNRPKSRSKPETEPNKKVFRFFKRLDNGDLLLFGFVPRYKSVDVEASSSELNSNI